MSIACVVFAVRRFRKHKTLRKAVTADCQLIDAVVALLCVLIRLLGVHTCVLVSMCVLECIGFRPVRLKFSVLEGKLLQLPFVKSKMKE